MSQTLLNTDQLTNESLMEFHNNLVLGRSVDRQYDDYFAKSGAKIGDTLRVREPVRMTSASGRTLSVNTITEKKKDILVATQRHVAWPFNSSDMALSLDEYSKRYIKPAMAELASQVDLAGYATAFPGIYNHVGTPGTDPNTHKVWLQAKAKLNQYSVPKGDKLVAIMNEDAEVETVDALKGLFNASSEIDKQYKNGTMGHAMGLDFNMSQNVPRFTNGTATALGTLSATATSGSSLAITGGTAGGTVKAGAVVTVASCYAFNLETRTSTGKLQQFVVTADVTLNGSGAGTLTVSPEIITSGNYQNMTSAGAVSGQAVSFVSGTTASTQYAQNLVFHPAFATLVTVDMPMVSAPKISRKTMEGISMRLIQTYDVINDQEIFRIDILFGWSLLRPEWACRVAGA
jgi:hypothetical protein